MKLYGIICIVVDMRSVYIHIPFCNSICSYCDFCKVLYKKNWANTYLNALKKEIVDFYREDEISSIYIGGGTPSSLSLEELNKLFEIIKVFKTTRDLEFTFEMNVNDINDEILLFLRKNKVNRISVGVESFNKNNLKFLNRKHNRKQIFDSIYLVKKYFNNFNVDLIYAIPIENYIIFKKDLNLLLKLKPTHISTYSLIIEKNTALYINDIKSIDEDTDYKMYKYICSKLKRKKYNHYEVSNFALDGYESKHNLRYWNNDEYYGFGLGSHGFIDGVRYENTRNLNKYLELNVRLNEIYLSKQEDMENEVILGLRKIEGIDVNKFHDKFNENIAEVFNINDGIKKGYLEYKDGNIRIKKDKIYVMNEILNEIIERN